MFNRKLYDTEFVLAVRRITVSLGDEFPTLSYAVLIEAACAAVREEEEGALGVRPFNEGFALEDARARLLEVLA